MRNRFWLELCQAKHNQRYCVLLLAYRRRILNLYTIIILIFSSAGIMGWTVWKEIPLIACFIISAIQLMRLLQPHFMPTEKQVDKLDIVVDFYFDYYNKLEKLWFEYDRGSRKDEEVEKLFYEIKDSEKEVNKTINEIIKSKNKKIVTQADTDAREYLSISFK